MPHDFSGQNLRGRSFKGQNLEGANFSYADIRSTDFTGANLRGANFSHTTAGLQKRWAIFLVCVSWLLSGISGFLSACAGALIALIFNSSNLQNQVVGQTILIVVIILFIVILCQGFNSAIAIAFTFAGAIAGVIFIIFAGATTTITDTSPQGFGFPFLIPGLKTGAEGFASIGTIAGAGGFAFIGAIAFTNAIAFGNAFAFAVAFAIAGIKAFTLAIAIAIAVALAMASSIAFIFAIFFANGSVEAFAITFTFAIAFTFTAALLSAYIVWRAIKGDEKYSLIQNIAFNFAASGGTSFRRANLTDANFTAATLKSTDFRKANLTRTCFNKTKQLNRVRPSKTYLQKAKVVSVLVTRQGQDKNFDRDDLRGVNFQGANLVDASFIGTDLSYANLQDADLSRAKLVQTQLNGTDLTGATLTGAYIQDWGITLDTLFDGVRCEYVYMRLPTKENPDPLRKPDNHKEVFSDGEFGDFIKPIFDTLDLYHNQGVDPRAIAISFKQLAENNPDAELEIVGMEKRGQDKFLLRAKTAIAADKSQLSAEYFATYNQLKALAEQEVKALIAEKDSRIADLQNMVVTALQRPSFYSNVEQVGCMTNNSSGFSVGGSVGGDINNVQGDNNQQQVNNKTSNFNLQNAQFGGGLVNADTVNANQIGGNITNYNTEQHQNLAQAAADIQQLLNQLSQTYPTTTTSQKMTVVAKAVDEIESNPTLKARVIGALKAGGTEAFKELIDHPLVNILLASIEGWQDAE
nr:pentapeptide repeat-containing protein [Dendronalium sp. ChiSLP03b]MDZ8208993.1 pentapeptide repeat-containing protein [Dendronalium sp. ChiSLP03b]